MTWTETTIPFLSFKLDVHQQANVYSVGFAHILYYFCNACCGSNQYVVMIMLVVVVVVVMMMMSGRR